MTNGKYQMNNRKCSSILISRSKDSTLSDQIPGFASIPPEQFGAFGICDKVFFRCLPIQFPAGFECDVAEMSDGRRAVADFDVRGWRLTRTHTLDEVSHVQIGRIFRSHALGFHPKRVYRRLLVLRPVASRPGLRFGVDFKSDPVGDQCAVGSVVGLTMR